MGFKVHIENFQSIVDETLEFSGLSTITGQNNSGKSVIVRAILSVFTNSAPSSYIHHGKDYMRVRIDFPDGAYVMWEKVGRRPTRGKSKGKLTNIKTNYEINGNRIEGVANSVPDEISDIGVRPIVLNRDSVWPQIAAQEDGVYFLINKPGSAVAEAVADVDRVAVLNYAMRECDSDHRSAASELKVRKKDAQDHKEKLETYKGLDAVIEMVQEVTDLHQSIKKVKKLWHLTTELRDKMERHRSEMSHLEPVASLEKIDDEDISKVSDAHRGMSKVTELKERLAGATREYDGLKDIDQVDLIDTDHVANAQEVLRKTGVVIGIRDVIRKAEKELGSVRGAADLASVDLDLVPTAERVIRLIGQTIDFRKRLVDGTKSLESCKEQLKDAEKEFQEVDEELEEFLKQHPKCPECGQFLREETA